MDFPEFTISHESQWEFQFIILEFKVKKSSLQTFPIDRFVKEVYRIVKILHKYGGLRRNNSLLIS